MRKIIKNENLFNKIIKNPLYIIIMIYCIIIIFSELLYKFSYSRFYIITNFILFIISLIISIYLIYRLVKRSKFDILKNDIDKILFFIVLSFSIFFIFIILKGPPTGRVSMLPFFYSIKSPRSFYFIFSLILNFFKINVTPNLLLYFNKIFAILFIILIYILTRIIFKNIYLSLLTTITFLSNIFIRSSFHTIEYSNQTLFFIYLCFLSLILFEKTKDKFFYYLLLVSIISASFFRYELSIILGISYITYHMIFYADFKKYTREFIIFFFILIYRSISIISHYAFNDDIPLKGVSEKGFYVLLNTFNLFISNISKGDLLLSNGRISIFLYLFIIFSIILIFNLIKKIIKDKKTINIKDKYIYMFVFFGLFHFIFQIFFHIDGMRGAHKYSINYFLCEVLIVYYVIDKIINYVINKYSIKKKIGKYISILFILILFYISFQSSAIITFNQNYSLYPIAPIEPHSYEMIYLLNNYQINDSCRFLKIIFYQPNIDSYYGIETYKRSIKLGKPPDYYDNLNNLNKNEACYYFYNQKDIIDKSFDNHYFLNITLIDKILKDCNKSLEIVVPIMFTRKNKTLYKYMC